MIFLNSLKIYLNNYIILILILGYNHIFKSYLNSNPLYDAIQTDSQLKISYKKGDAKILEGEQNKAKRTVRLWLSLSGN